MSQKKNQFESRLNSQIEQLKKHGYSAEVVIRTTPEATDIINYARLWEHIIVQADRKTRGYMAKSSRDDFDKTRRDFQECMSVMSEKIQQAAERHDLDLTGTNFVSRIAQRYSISEKVRKNPPQSQVKPVEIAQEPKKEPEVKKIALDEVDGL
ncbi:MAG TPA: hypothetical protein DCL21_00375 [Alphaproteobacteria bacterium]|nr:hypothetical protein [Alphaproteobacteria bacterium]